MMKTAKKDIDLLKGVFGYAERFATAAVTAAGAAGIERLTGRFTVAIGLHPFTIALLVNDRTIAERDGDTELDALVAPLVERGLERLPPRAQQLAAKFLPRSADIVLLIAIGQERPNVCGRLVGRHDRTKSAPLFELAIAADDALSVN